MEQNATINDVTESEEKLLEVLLNPNYRNLSITEKCNKAEISRSTYYRAFSKSDFKDKVSKESKELVFQYLSEIVLAVVDEAKKGSFQHAKLILEMAGLHTDKLEQSGETKIKVTIEDD